MSSQRLLLGIIFLLSTLTTWTEAKCPIEILRSSSEYQCSNLPNLMFPNLFCYNRNDPTYQDKVHEIINPSCPNVDKFKFGNGICIKFLIDDPNGYFIKNELSKLCSIPNSLSRREINSELIAIEKISISDVHTKKTTILKLPTNIFVDSADHNKVMVRYELYRIINDEVLFVDDQPGSWIKFKDNQITIEPKVENIGEHKMRLCAFSGNKSGQEDFILKVVPPTPNNIFPVSTNGNPGVLECKSFPVTVFNTLKPYQDSDLIFKYTCTDEEFCSFQQNKFCYVTPFSPAQQKLVANFTIMDQKNLTSVNFKFIIELRQVILRQILSNNSTNLRFKILNSQFSIDSTKRIITTIAQILNKPIDQFFILELTTVELAIDAVLLQIALVYLKHGHPVKTAESEWLSQVAVHNIDSFQQKYLLDKCQEAILPNVCDTIRKNSGLFGDHKFVDCQQTVIPESICNILDGFKNQQDHLVTNLINPVFVEPGFLFRQKINFHRGDESLDKIHSMEILTKNRVVIREDSPTTWLAVDQTDGYIYGVYLNASHTLEKTVYLYLRYKSVREKRTFLSPFNVTILPRRIPDVNSNDVITLRVAFNQSLTIVTKYQFMLKFNKFIDKECVSFCIGATRVETIVKESDYQYLLGISRSEFYNTEKTTIFSCPHEYNKFMKRIIFRSTMNINQWSSPSRKLIEFFQDLAEIKAGNVMQRGPCVLPQYHPPKRDNSNIIYLSKSSGRMFSIELKLLNQSLANGHFRVYDPDGRLSRWIQIRNDQLEGLMMIRDNIQQSSYNVTLENITQGNVFMNISMDMKQTEKIMPPMNHQFIWTFRSDSLHDLSFKLRFWDTLADFVLDKMNIYSDDIILNDWNEQDQGYTVYWALVPLWKTLDENHRVRRNAATKECIDKIESYINFMIEPTKDGPNIDLVKKFFNAQLGTLKRIAMQPIGKCIKTPGYFPGEEDPKPFVPTVTNFGQNTSVIITPKTQDYLQILKIILPLILVIIFLLLLGIILLWYLKFKSKASTKVREDQLTPKKDNSSTTQANQTIFYKTKQFFSKRSIRKIPEASPSDVTGNQLQINSKCQKLLDDSPTSISRNSHLPQQPQQQQAMRAMVNKRSSSNPYQQDSFQENEQTGFLHHNQHHQNTHYSSQMPDHPQVSYVMPKSQYFKKPNPYRNMPPPIDCNVPYTRNSRF